MALMMLSLAGIVRSAQTAISDTLFCVAFQQTAVSRFYRIVMKLAKFLRRWWIIITLASGFSLLAVVFAVKGDRGSALVCAAFLVLMFVDVICDPFRDRREE